MTNNYSICINLCTKRLNFTYKCILILQLNEYVKYDTRGLNCSRNFIYYFVFKYIIHVKHDKNTVSVQDPRSLE